MGRIAELIKKSEIGRGRLSKLSPAEKEVPRFKGDVMSWIDRYLRSQYATAGVVKEWGRATREQRPGEYHKAFKAGITGREKTYYRDVFKEAGYGPKTSGILGFAGDVLLDPLTYVTLGTTAAAKPGVKVGIKGIAKKAVGKKAAERALALKFAGRPIVKSVAAAKGMAKAGQAIVKAPGIGKAIRLFVKTTGNPKLDALFKKHTLAKQYGRLRAMKVGNKEVRHMFKLADRLGKPVKEVADEIVNLMEIQKIPSRIKAKATHPLIGRTAIRHAKMYKTIIAAEMRAGVKVKPLGTKKLMLLAKTRDKLSKLLQSRKIAKRRGLDSRVACLNREIKLIKSKLPKGEVPIMKRVKEALTYERKLTPKEMRALIDEGVIAEGQRVTAKGIRLGKAEALVRKKAPEEGMTAPQWIKFFRDVSPQEMEWRGITKILDSPAFLGGKTTKAQMLDFLKRRRIPLTRYTAYGPTAEFYVEKVGTKYMVKNAATGATVSKEFKSSAKANAQIKKMLSRKPHQRYMRDMFPGGEYREYAYYLPEKVAGKRLVSGRTHLGERLYGHAMVTIRKTKEGKKVFFIDELQGDWAKSLRRGLRHAPGYPTDAPFIKQWYRSVLKDLTRQAAKENVDYIAWNSAEVIAERWGDLGVAKFYEEVIPTVMSKITKRHGAQTVKLKLPGIQIQKGMMKGYPTAVEAIEITPQMRKFYKPGLETVKAMKERMVERPVKRVAMRKLTGEQLMAEGVPGTRQVAKRMLAREKGIASAALEKERIVALGMKRVGKKGIVFKPTEKEMLSISKELKIGRKEANRIAKLRKGRDLGYFPRISKAEAMEFLKEAKIGKKKIWSPNLANAIERKTGDFTLQEWNTFVKKHGITGLDSKTLDAFFSPDPAYALAKRMERGITATDAVKLRKEAARIFGRSPKLAPKHWPIIEGRRVSPEIAGEVDKMYKFYTSDESVAWFAKKVFDPIQKWWKAHVLSYFPGYHTRNVATNTMNNYWAGVWNIKDFHDAVKLQLYRNMKLAGKKVSKPVLHSGVDVDLAIKMGERYGVPGRGLMSIEVPRALEIELMKGNWNVVSQNFYPVKYGRHVGTMLENNARWWHFLDKVRHGKSWSDSATSVKKFLFDYADLTEFERRFMKRVLPFYTWTRKNLPLQIEQIIKQPGKYAGYIKAKRAIEARTPAPPQEEAMLPEWLKKRWPMRIGKTEKGEYTYFPLESYLPIADIFKLQRPGRAAVEMLDPYFIKGPLEQVLNRNIYFDRPIEAIPGERQRFLGKEMPSRAVHMLRTLRILGEINRLMPKYGPDIEERYKEMLPPELTAGQKALRALTGIKLEKVHPEKSLRYYKFDLQNKLRDIKNAYRRAKMRGRTKEAERLKEQYRKTKIEGMRKLGR